MPKHVFTPRALRADDELDAYYALCVRTFMGIDAVDPLLPLFRRRDETGRDRHEDRHRGVVRDGELLGGYTMHDRNLRFGPARIRTACIGGVATDPSARGQGVARALMEDAVQYAIEHGYALLLLDGIPDFYPRFGYVDVFDVVVHTIDVGAIPAEAPHDHRVRPATIDDAPAILSLYRRHNGTLNGSVDWTLEEIEHEVRFRIERGREPDLVQDGGGTVAGYWFGDRGGNEAFEVAGDTPEAVITLLHHHARWVTAPEGEAPVLRWGISPESMTYYFLADHLGRSPRSPDTRRPYSLTSERGTRADADWVARPAHLPTLLQNAMPLLKERWARHGKAEVRSLSLQIGEDGLNLEFEGDRLLPGETLKTTDEVVSLSPNAFTQLLCGFRPVWWVVKQEGIQISAETQSLLEVLFPTGGFWLPGVDHF